MEGREGVGNPLHFNRSPETFLILAGNGWLSSACWAFKGKTSLGREQELVPRAPFGMRPREAMPGFPQLDAGICWFSLHRDNAQCSKQGMFPFRNTSSGGCQFCPFCSLQPLSSCLRSVTLRNPGQCFHIRWCTSLSSAVYVTKVTFGKHCSVWDFLCRILCKLPVNMVYYGNKFCVKGM